MTTVHGGRETRFSGPDGCRRTFLKFFPAGFRDEQYLSWEREYKWTAHQRWSEQLEPRSMRGMMQRGDYAGIARAAVAIESRTNVLFSFEKMALRDAVRTAELGDLFVPSRVRRAGPQRSATVAPSGYDRCAVLHLGPGI